MPYIGHATDHRCPCVVRVVLPDCREFSHLSMAVVLTVGASICHTDVQEPRVDIRGLHLLNQSRLVLSMFVLMKK